jgi:hypothetical protein
VVPGFSAIAITEAVVSDSCGNGVFCYGVKNFKVTNSANVSGMTDICISSPSYLQQGAVLCESNTANVTNAGRATFGIYKSNGSIIYMRENY